jgi:hypothetical protein
LLIGDQWTASLLKLRRLLILASISGQWAVSSSPLVTLLVEGRPIIALAPCVTCASSSSRLDAIGEAVLQRCGLRLSILLEMERWHTGGPKWFIPSDRRIVSTPLQPCPQPQRDLRCAG